MQPKRFAGETRLSAEEKNTLSSQNEVDVSLNASECQRFGQGSELNWKITHNFKQNN